MVSNLAYCGLNCEECAAYIAMRTNDDGLRVETLKKWNSPEFPLVKEDINCNGCKSSDGVHFKFCGDCAVRNCASERMVETCAHCPDYGCETLEEWLSHAGEKPREILENLRSSLE